MAPHPLTFLELEMRAADEQIEQLLAKGAIMQCDSINENNFVSMVFLHPKKDRGFRMILNLKGFNEYIEYQHFKMETIKDIMHAIVPNCFMAVADLSDAYLVVLISKWHWRLKILLERQDLLLSCLAFWVSMCSEGVHKSG